MSIFQGTLKRINDTLGHSAGDELLKEIAVRLEDCIRSSDIFGKFVLPIDPKLSMSRLTGDEFSILLTDLSEEEYTIRVIQRILEMLQAPININGQEIIISCSMGISVFPGDAEEVDPLLKSANMAMFHAKESGGNTWRFFSHEMNDRAVERMNIEIDLQKALEREEFVLMYQPQVELGTGKLVGLEALVRWQHPKLGLVSPFTFISVAEESALILPLGEWVLNEACRQAYAWRQAGLTPVRMGVNVSSHQFRQEDLVSIVQEALQKSGLPPSFLELEVTESSIMQDIDKTINVLGQLKEIGVKISVDDFGTGYSSLNYLKRFPLDTLKIDRSFITDIISNSNDAAIVTAIIAMAESLGLRTIAEGVETQEQLQYMRQKMCGEIQGFLISKPLKADELEHFMKPGLQLC
ncbi:MAG: EAL domain-containing protein [Desulfobulbaceae bacterium]|uniref:EAL domain-containing protein n=1 Tax=Candidatus Desulfatifera sulfidica TaxID=2841691 RepID=A0A8J6N8H1_9BACT|nr:EAL domain-containing protein [Candidatus Desulfatifera sulfidica]